MKKAPTLKDVAVIAGVSPYTVSAILNGARSNTQVSAATRRRIMESAATLDYHPNAVARSLASRKTNTLGVQFGVLKPTSAMANAYASALLQGMMLEAAAHHNNVLLFTETWVSGAKSAPRFRDRRTDGVVLIAPLTDSDMLSALSDLPIPLVAISPDPMSCPSHIPSVDVDNIKGIQIAVEHLVALGHTRIAHVTGNENVASVIIRKDAFVTAMNEAGLPIRPEYIVAATYDGRAVPAVFPALMELAEPPTAIIAGNDNIALAILANARERNICVPSDLSVVGFDDIPTARQVTPALTTIRQPLVEIGQTAVSLLLAEIESAQTTETRWQDAPHLVAPEIIIRESTATPRS